MKKRNEDTELLIPGSDSEYDSESQKKKYHPQFNQWPHVFNLANCIVGVSVLAMPYVFQQCGVLLAVLMIFMCSILMKLTCHFLSEGAQITRRYSYEALALSAFGPIGRRCIEMLMVFFLMSSIVAFMVMIGDIGPNVVADYLELEAPTQKLRILVMVLVLLFIIFPLSCIKDLGNFSVISSAAVFFYAIFVVRLFWGSLPVFWEGHWSVYIEWWRPAGFLACLPIVAMALSCQTQLFCVMECMKDARAEDVEQVSSSAINICSMMYAGVGIFGYVTYYNEELHGDVLVNLDATLFTQLLKLSFMLSIAVSIPLMLFPARIALFNLCLRKGSGELPVSNLQHSTFYILTFIILFANTLVAIVVPNVEFILGLTGSLIGSLVCIVVPSLMFIWVSSARDQQHQSIPYAKVCVAVGLTILLASTWATLQKEHKSVVVERPLPKADPQVLKSLEKLEEQVLDSNINISQKLDEVADLAKKRKDKEAEKLLEEMKVQQKEQQKLIKKQEDLVEELNKHVELHHNDEVSREKENETTKEKEKESEKERDARNTEDKETITGSKDQGNATDVSMDTKDVKVNVAKDVNKDVTNPPSVIASNKTKVDVEVDKKEVVEETRNGTHTQSPTALHSAEVPVRPDAVKVVKEEAKKKIKEETPVEKEKEPERSVKVDV